ncbi:hypothetical protein HJC23_012027 [Cyclotella cryptica]|uniref:FAD/NAD(P)-binding domain-containing protein n=1 Tax=Cyclotella cryptica TaxID=29204 RepID=A0ABD3PSW1_9STRA|eukprot:CCRYP_012324-RC/>CCRYP_012324-RC protein AED:0.01 eAED:0.01 QI:67/1/1/1/1/1/2/1373/678
MLFTRLSSLHCRGRHRAALRHLSSKAAPGTSRFHVPSRGRQQLLMGCVSYDPAVNDIWIGIQSYLNRAMAAGGSDPFDFCLFTNYPAQVRALLDGHIDVAWNGPIAHVMAERGVQTSDSLLSLGMRDVDRDFRSVLVTRTSRSIRSVQQLQDRLVLAGSWDSPQANVVPLYWLTVLEGVQPRIVEYNVDVGKHGDTAAGEVMLLKELCAMAHSGPEEGADGAVLSKMMWDRALEGRLEGVDPTLLSEHYDIMADAKIPAFDHCQFDAVYNPDKIELLEDFTSALMQMDMNDPEQQRLMCLEGINKEWVPPRQEGYDIVRKAMDVGMGASSSNHKPATNLFTVKSSFLLNQRGAHTFHRQSQQLRSFSSNASGTQSLSRPKTIAVIGAGVAGLQTTRALQSHGFQVKCFDANSKVGGLWNSNYANFGVQVPKQLYEVQDFPMTEAEEGEYPSAVQVQRYLERMVKEFRLQDSIQLNTFVESVDQKEDGTWEVSIKQLHSDGSTSTQERHSFDYLVSATGLYSNRDAFLPSDIDGTDKYQGQILHSSQFSDVSIAKGQRVIVVGGGKSAIDCAVEAHRAGAAHVTLLSRKAHWPTPRKIAGVIPFQYVFLSRFGTALVSAHRGVYPDEGTGKAVSLFRTFGWPIVGGAFYAVEALFRLQLGLFGDRSPKADVVDDFYGEI